MLYSKKKLKADDRQRLEQELDGLMFTCGSSLEELELPAPLNEVYVRNVNCADPIEKLYYSAGYDPICIYCAANVTADRPEYYPQCCECKQPMIKKK